MPEINSKITAWREAVFAIIRAKYETVSADVESKVSRINRCDDLEELAGLAALCSTFERFQKHLNNKVELAALTEELINRYRKIH
jgi:ABC-type transporter Mla MlaB component